MPVKRLRRKASYSVECDAVFRQDGIKLVVLRASERGRLVVRERYTQVCSVYLAYLQTCLDQVEHVCILTCFEVIMRMLEQL